MLDVRTALSGQVSLFLDENEFQFQLVMLNEIRQGEASAYGERGEPAVGDAGRLS
jgi:hypothetical protein